MTARLDIPHVLPSAFDRLLALNSHIERLADQHEVPRALLELVKIRCSQLNGCAHCLDQHTGAALKAGEDPRRLHLLATWHEAGDLFDPAERAALALAEAVTKLSQLREVPDAIYDAAAQEFNTEQLAVVLWAVGEIQLFNSLNVTARSPLVEQ